MVSLKFAFSNQMIWIESLTRFLQRSCSIIVNLCVNTFYIFSSDAIGNVGMDMYQCELCKMVVSERPSLIEHYGQQHGLDFSTVIPKQEVEETCQPPSPPPPPDQPTEIPTELEETITSPPLPSPPPLKQASSSKRRKSVQKERKDTDAEELVTETPILVEENGLINTLEGTDKKEYKDFTFIYSTETIKGAKLTFTRSWFKCLHCDFKTRMKRCLVKHMGERHAETFAAVHDNMEVKGEPEYNVHQKVGESQSRLMRMSVYDRMFPIMGQQRKRRLEKQDIPGVYTCNQCNKVFSRLRYLRKHSKQHALPSTKTACKAGDKKFTCEQCGKAFKFKHYLQAHKRSHDTKIFRCNECDFVSNINAAIHAHRQIHNQGSVLCDICGYAYSDKSTLTKHYRVHDLTRPYACTFQGCTWRFKTEIMCRAHIRAHTTEGKFRCWVCGYLFRHKHHLQRHVSKMHKLKLSVKEMDAQVKYQSARSTVTESDAIEIAAEVTPQIEIQCKDCCLDFDTKEQLEEHFTKFHHVHLSVQELNDFYNANLIPNSGENGDSGKYVITATVNSEDLEQSTIEGIDAIQDQQVYAAIDQGTLTQFEADPNAPDVNQIYVQEEQYVIAQML